MLDFSHIPESVADIQVFTGNSPTAGAVWQTWVKPRGKTMCSIWMVGKGGNGGNGAVGAVSAAAGGGGGGSGGIITLLIPMSALPNILYLSLAGQSATTTLASYITTYPSVVVNHTIAIANGGGNGGNASAGTGGTAGGAGAASAVGSMPLGWPFKQHTPVASAQGVAGAAGASAVYTAAQLIVGTTVFGGTGGAGVPAAGAVGNINAGYAAVGSFPAHTYVNTATAATLPGTPGPDGILPIPGMRIAFGGLGGGSSHGSATGAGLFGGKGGNGIMGSGGGGGGGCLTGGTAGLGGQGGPAMAIITSF